MCLFSSSMVNGSFPCQSRPSQVSSLADILKSNETSQVQRELLKSNGSFSSRTRSFLKFDGSFSSQSRASQVNRELLLLVLLLSLLLLLLLLLSSPAAFAFLPSLQKVSASQRAAQVGMHFLTLLYMLACCNLRVPVSCLMAMRRPQPLLPLQPYDSVSP